MKTGTDETGKTRGIVGTKATGAKKGNRRTERTKEQGEE